MKKHFKFQNIAFVMILGLSVLSMSSCKQADKPAQNAEASNERPETPAPAPETPAPAPETPAPAPETPAPAPETPAPAPATTDQVTLTPEAQMFKNDLMGEWTTTDGRQIWKFSEDKLETKFTGGQDFASPRPYRIVDAKTIDYDNGSKATITFEDNGNTLDWDGGGRFKLKRATSN